MIILYVLIGLLVGGLGIYLLLRPKLKITARKNIEIELENTNLDAENAKLSIQNNNLNSEYKVLLEQRSKITIDNAKLQAEQETIQKNIGSLKETQSKMAQDFYSQALNIAENSYEKEIDRISDDLFQHREEAKNLYLQVAEEAVQEFEEAIESKQKEFSYWNGRIVALQKDVQVALEAAQRKLAMETQQDYYRICLSDEDVAEIKRLREVLPYLRDKAPLNKVIYKVYYERPLTDMIGRVVGSGVHTGIYKITNIDNQMCYVGQAANIADRWKQHCKRGVGAEDWTQNKLYPAMYTLGVENFTFEIVEECDRSKLNEREDYWQNYFHAKDFGYSIK